MKIILIELRVHDSTDIEDVVDAEAYLRHNVPVDIVDQVVNGICGVIDVDENDLIN